MKRLVWSEGVPRLAGSECPNCGHTTIPRRANCPACGSGELIAREMGPRATVERFAELHVPFDGNDAPYAIGLVRIAGEGPQVITRIEGEAVRGGSVELQGDRETDAYWFRAVATTANNQ